MHTIHCYNIWSWCLSQVSTSTGFEYRYLLRYLTAHKEMQRLESQSSWEETNPELFLVSHHHQEKSGRLPTSDDRRDSSRKFVVGKFSSRNSEGQVRKNCGGPLFESRRPDHPTEEASRKNEPGSWNYYSSYFPFTKPWYQKSKSAN